MLNSTRQTYLEPDHLQECYCDPLLPKGACLSGLMSTCAKLLSVRVCCQLWREGSPLSSWFGSNISLWFLGRWNPDTGFKNFSIIQKVLNRSLSKNNTFVVGLKNDSKTSRDGKPGVATDDLLSLLEVGHYFRIMMKANMNIVWYTSLGGITPDGVWTHLLGGVIAQQIDLGLDYVSTSGTKRQSLYFTQPLIEGR